jgi:hypothetical protein
MIPEGRLNAREVFLRIKEDSGISDFFLSEPVLYPSYPTFLIGGSSP